MGEEKINMKDQSINENRQSLVAGRSSQVPNVSII